jgi:hypothetical protein
MARRTKAATVRARSPNQAAVVVDPRQGSFDDPALGQDHKLVQFVALDDFDGPAPRADGMRGARSLIAGIGEDALDERKTAAGSLVVDQSRAVATSRPWRSAE